MSARGRGLDRAGAVRAPGGELGAARARRYLDVAAVAERYGWSTWTVYDKARRKLLPHRKHSGSNALLFLESELDAFDDGAVLEVVRLPRGGRVVRPRRQDL